jgi:hypothetical protein
LIFFSNHDQPFLRINLPAREVGRRPTFSGEWEEDYERTCHLKRARTSGNTTLHSCFLGRTPFVLPL